MNKDYSGSELSRLVAVAIGNEQHVNFAERIGMSKHYLSRILNNQLSGRPSKELLNKIAQQSGGSVTAAQLILAAGYDPSERVAGMSHFRENGSHLYSASILVSLSYLDVDWIFLKDGKYDLTISMPSCKNALWHFVYLPDGIGLMEEIYKKILFLAGNDLSKTSFVTSKKDVYEYYISNVPSVISMNLSIILIDTKSVVVKEEHMLKSSSGTDISMLSFNI